MLTADEASAANRKSQYCNTFVNRLAYDLERVVFECGPLISVPNPVMGQERRFRGKATDGKRRVLAILLRPSEDGVVTIARIPLIMILPTLLMLVKISGIPKSPNSGELI
jgi:hypothetical protein